MSLLFASLSFYLTPPPALLFLVAGLALRCHVSPSSQTKNLPAMKSTSEREEGRENEDEDGGAREKAWPHGAGENMYV